MSASAALEKKTRKLAEAHDAAERRVSDLAAKSEALSSFDDPADAGKLIAARGALEAARQERDVLAGALEAARKAHAAAVAEEEARALEERYGRMRKEVAAFGASITSDLVALGKKLAAHESLADALPASERYRFWPADYCAAASKELTANVDMNPKGATGLAATAAHAMAVQQIDLRLVVPVSAAE